MRYFIPLIVWLITCTVLFTLPGNAFPKTGWLTKIWFDKWVHVGIHASLVFLAAWGYYRYQHKQIRLRRILFLALIFSIYGLAIEFVQLYFVKNRSFDGGDVVADIIGAAGGGFYSWFQFIKTSRTN